LRKQVGASTSQEPLPSEPADGDDISQAAEGFQHTPTSKGAYSPCQPQTVSTTSLGAFTQYPQPSASNDVESHDTISRKKPSTQSQTIQDLSVDAQDIDGCFDM
jgi:hypothetical protein